MTDTQKRALGRAERAIEAAKSAAKGTTQAWAAEDVRLVVGYAEPGYGGDDALVAFANWNGRNCDRGDVMPRLAKVLEKLGFECQWSDEWTECAECYRAIRTSPDCYSWKRSYVETDDGCVCEECTLKYAADYLESAEGRPDFAVTLGVDPGEHDYFCPKDLSEIDTGYHPGQDGDPRKVAKLLRARGIERFLFKLDSVGQFDGRWSVWIHDEERQVYEEARVSEGEIDPNGFSPSGFSRLNVTGMSAFCGDLPWEIVTAPAGLACR